MGRRGGATYGEYWDMAEKAAAMDWVSRRLEAFEVLVLQNTMLILIAVLAWVFLGAFIV